MGWRSQRGGRQLDGALPTLDGLQLGPQAKAVEVLTDVLGAGLTLGPVGFAQAFGVREQFARDHVWIGEAIGTAFSQHVPNGYQQLASNRHNGLVVAQARLEACQLSLPVRVSVAGDVGGFDHGRPDVAPASLGNLAGATREATLAWPAGQAVVDTGT